jgi:arylsulfatase A-like enzyme
MNERRAPHQPRSVVVVACNAFHLGFLGTYGNAWIETPQLDRFAAESVVFDHHFADNLTTLPTRRSWWTGRYGFADPEQGWAPLRHDERILPDVLASQGVRTALVSDNPYLREPGQGFGRGFDHVAWVRGSGYDPFIPANDPRVAGIDVRDETGLPLPADDDPDLEIWLTRWSQLLRNRAALQLNSDADHTNVARTVREAIGWLERASQASEPFVLWIDLFAPHGPWDLPTKFRDMYAAVEPDEFELDEEGNLASDMLADDAPESLEHVRALIDVPPSAVGDVLSEAELLRLRRTYAGAVTLLDSQFGVLFDALRRLGRLDDTLVIFTADQGEPLGEHGYVRRFRPWLYDELIHTPLIVRYPGARFGGGRHRALVQPVDLFPTVLEAVGVAYDESEIHGRSWLSLIRGESTKLRDYACMGMDVEEFALRTHNWHLVLPLEADPEDPARGAELYRKPEDRWDQNNVADQFRDVADQLELVLRRFAEATLRGDVETLPPLRDIARLGGVS